MTVSFFFRHRPGMLLPAAKVLQQREVASQDTRRERRLTLCALVIAVLAIVADVVVQSLA